MKTIKFKNQELERVIEIAKQNNYRVFAFQHNEPISQIFVVSENDEIGSISATFGGLSYATVHKPCRGFGSGFGLSGYLEIEVASLNKIKQCTTMFKPNWAGRGDVKKYNNWEEYVNTPINRILNYFEI